MENLPLLVLEKIFSELTNLNEVIRCSGVCRNWRAAYEVCKPTTLCLYFDFMPLNHRLAYSTERVRRCEFFKTSEDLQFLASEITKTHFANIRKLIIIAPIRRNSRLKYHPFSFEKQLNPFRKLEYIEIQRFVCLHLEDSELDLPMLKVLCFNTQRNPEEFYYKEETLPKVVLHTPSLEILEVQPRQRSFGFSEFILKFPHQLRSLTAILDTFDTPFKTKFERLKCLAVRIKKLRDNFLSSFPSLKLLLLFISCDDRDELKKKLMEQKKRYGLDDLEIFEKHKEDNSFNFYLDHENWRKYVRHEETVQYCPVDLAVDFNGLIEHDVPPNLFKSFFRLNILSVGNVTDESPLFDFLRIVRTFIFFNLTPEFNLDVDFLDQVASFLTVHRLHFPENVLNRLSDYTFLEKFNYSELSINFKVTQKNLPRKAASVALRKPNGHVDFQFDRETNENGQYVGWGHFIERDQALGFVCVDCKWDSTKDSDSDPIEATIKHAEECWFFPPEPDLEVIWNNLDNLFDLDVNLLNIDDLLDI